MRYLLIGFPAGLIVFSIIAVFIYFHLEEQRTARSIRYASGLRKEMTAQGLAKHEQILSAASADVLKGKLTASSYLCSTVSAENMGYQARVLRTDSAPDTPIAAIDVELTGTKRPKDIVLVLGDYGSAKSAAALVEIAHDIAGQAPLRTLRMSLLQDESQLPYYYNEAVDGKEQLAQVLLLGRMAQQSDEALRGVLRIAGASTQFLRPDINSTVRTPLQSAEALKQQMLDLAARY
jgi:hypothetical protein